VLEELVGHGEGVFIATFGAWPDDALQHLVIIKDQDEALGRANDERGSNIQTGRPPKIPSANLGEELTGYVLQLGPAHYVPRGLRGVCFRVCVLGRVGEEQVAREGRLAGVGRQEGRRGAARGDIGRGREGEAGGEAAVEGLEGMRALRTL
jgi:hypothetical protein